jgi:hypothetical protein
MVCPKHHIRGLEEEWFSNMGSWKSYVSLAQYPFLHSCLSFISEFRSRCGKKHLVVRGFSLASVIENS